MKKKKQKTGQHPPTTAATTTTTTVDLKCLIRDQSLFFDKLIELIPAKFYLPTDDDAKPWFQGLSKSAKEAAKQQTRENIKKSRRERLDPKKSQASTLELLKQSIENEKQATKSTLDSDDDELEHGDVKPIAGLDDGGGGSGGDRSVTYEELRQRLHRRIEELRGNRGGGEEWKTEKRERKRKRSGEWEEKSGREGKAVVVSKSEGEIEKDVAEATKGIAFGKVRIGGEEESGRKKKKVKLSKEKELERARRLQEAKKDPEKGEVVAKKHSWNAAVSRAAGSKVHDDPKLLKQSIQKEKRRHVKNAEKWKERVESRENVKKEKQQKRAGNIAERIREKKQRKIAKREKKLMRPGFEGRKEGYINAD